MNEVLAYAVGAASLFGVVAPNSGNQTILVKYGTEEQKRKWLIPLIEGKLESGFSMTEPDQPGSDPRSLRTTARRDGDEWHCCVGCKSDTTPADRAARRVYEPNETADNGPHKSPI